MENQAEPVASKPAPRWQPVSALDRRVLGVLVEKAKTTPDAYPMSVSAITAAANQKSNRFPMMQVEPDDVQDSLDRLRQLGAIGEVQGGGRVPRFRHYLYDWLDVDKVELAVMAELLLRGAQTEGELRGRAARMEPIVDLNALRPVLNSLKAKKLVIPLTPEGRGHVVTHALYEPRELERVRSEQSALDQSAMSQPLSDAVPARSRPAPNSPPPAAAADFQAQLDDLRRELAELRDDLAALRAALTQ
jgi:uncharacterized protein